MGSNKAMWYGEYIFKSYKDGHYFVDHTTLAGTTTPMYLSPQTIAELGINPEDVPVSQYF